MILGYLDINRTLFTLFGYQMSYLEFAGSILNLLSVWLVVRNNIWTWPIGNVAVILYALLFYQIRLYSDFVEQIYFLITGFYGWWVWFYYRRPDKKTKKLELSITYNSAKSNIAYLVIILAGSIIMAHVMRHIHEYLPVLFPKPASFPFLDAFTTVMSFAATILMAHKKIECWYLWILVDIIGIGLYFTKSVVFVSILYVLFLCLATKGLFNWRRLVRVTA
jgi:nicotinamide mononucleotide transporter